MPDTGPYSGNDGVVKIGANTIAQVTKFKYNETLSTRDQTKLGDTHEQPKGGLKAVSGSIEGWLERSDTNGQEAMDVGNEVTLLLHHNGAATGAPLTTITALITSKDIDNGDGNSTVNVAFNFVGNGATPYVEGEVA